MSHPPLTLGAVARHFGCRPWQVRRLFESGKLPEPRRVGAYRVFTPDELPRIEAALRQAGYLPEGGPHAA
jgi:DNA-binding transcriptional MerR regulator